jgi:TPR repeat protein
MIKSSLFALIGALVLLAAPTLSFAQSNGTESQQFRDLRARAESGDAAAQNGLAIVYASGVGVSKSDAEAVKWKRKAADQGHMGAQYGLGNFYYDGVGVPKNDAEAAKWYRRAAEQGHMVGQLSLGVMYAKGEGVPKNDVEAYFWFNLAAAQEYDDAKKNRDIVAKRMSREQIAEAQRRSAEWKPRKK